ncbi:hypothetical protein HanRHA438_Chr03g0115031 [Helianthus annuus]|uniref:Uncharacterized protein n=1 Tax=Helianthus annuus TaxID=4232 RepID=A0A251V7Y9_HELAN|nr:hypothetical protein HanXRQr2_Chr03g0104101 [Helianthus annuus]KAJ0592580.1 hypothetical protein HanHA300_Chr03g0086781 [Helianthus annuus]KAJ0600178.1 hypothetical protein HanIR_Chr03g0113601 [Helianthus annuus]KAJ0607577.1 hypothetical protein HanHA89_Chr03g0098351 [Helianthus annuus]KAJ0767638.1 hypothetical protein HanLR1_Chr03g0091681 [Helianthus annuus]
MNLRLCEGCEGGIRISFGSNLWITDFHFFKTQTQLGFLLQSLPLLHSPWL